MFVRFIFKHPVALLANMLVLLAEKRLFPAGNRPASIEDSWADARMCPLFFASNLFFVIQTTNPRI